MFFLLILITAYVLIGGVTGCQMSGENFREFKKENLTAKGAIRSDGIVEYYSIEIGDVDSPFDPEDWRFLIRISDTSFSSEELSRELVAELSVEKNEVKLETPGNADASRFFVAGYSFTFLEDRLITIRIANKRLPDVSYRPEIANVKEERFFPLPISELDLVSVFGEPDDVQDSRIN